MNKRIFFVLLALGACVAVGCGDDDDDSLPADTEEPDASDDDNDGVCDLAECPMPEMGIACCTPNGSCGFDPTGIGLVCAANAAEGAVCVLDDCPQPELGNPCCTPFGTCGTDPFANGIFCFAVSPDLEVPEPDSGAPTCDVEDCPEAEVGDACCLPDGGCGTDPFAIGWCFPPAEEVDGGFPDSGLVLPPIETAPPDDISVDGQCPSYLGLFGPVWGCCSEYGVCGTFTSETCLIPVGVQIPVEGEDDEEDAGMSLPGVMLCVPPTDD